MKKILAMKDYVPKFVTVAVISLVFSAFSAPFASAQQQKELSPEEQEKQLVEYIQKRIEKMEVSLKLEDWQVFYLDSIFNHDYYAMTAEVESLKQSKVSNSDIYLATQDKWSEKIDSALRKVFTDVQWEKYMKSGARREASDRQKRREKAAKAAQELKEGGN